MLSFWSQYGFLDPDSWQVVDIGRLQQALYMHGSLSVPDNLLSSNVAQH